MNNPAPGFIKRPDHKLEITPFEGHVSVSIDGQEIAKTDRALMLAEADYPVVFYVPLGVIPEKMLAESDHKTWCPFKGHASYYHLTHEGDTRENAIWTYRNPFDEAMSIRDYVAIYPSAASVEPSG
ncbi:MAG: DUF427 domain-containing protein [Pseudomonadota bacterium]